MVGVYPIGTVLLAPRPEGNLARLVMWNLVSLDGFFEGPGSDFSFLQYAWGPELESFIRDQSNGVGTIVFGRRTYEGMAAYWGDKNDAIGQIMNRTPKVVFSRSLSSARWANTRIARGDLRSEVGRITQESASDAFVLGSGNLCAQLAKEDLIDEYRLGIVSRFLGQGTPLLGDLRATLDLDLLEARALGPKAALVRYRSAKR